MVFNKKPAVLRIGNSRGTGHQSDLFADKSITNLKIPIRYDPHSAALD